MILCFQYPIKIHQILEMLFRRNSSGKHLALAMLEEANVRILGHSWCLNDN